MTAQLVAPKGAVSHTVFGRVGDNLDEAGVMHYQTCRPKGTPCDRCHFRSAEVPSCRLLRLPAPR